VSGLALQQAAYRQVGPHFEPPTGVCTCHVPGIYTLLLEWRHVAPKYVSWPPRPGGAVCCLTMTTATHAGAVVVRCNGFLMLV
jgi:hypothetical protein